LSEKLKIAEAVPAHKKWSIFNRYNSNRAISSNCICGNVFKWFTSNLCNKRQFTEITDDKSNLAKIVCGIPQ
jgi:hypothetical protein